MSGQRASNRVAGLTGALRGHGWVTLLYKELLRFWKVAFR